MNAHERRLLLANGLLQRVLAAVERDGVSPAEAAEAELARRARAPVSDELLLEVERAITAAVARLPPATVAALFADDADFEVKHLKEHFAPVLESLERAARGSRELAALGVGHLRAWHWERELVAWRRFLASGGRDHDALAQRPAFWRPDVPAKAFWTLDELPAPYRALEAAAPAILEELQAVRRDGAWLPYWGVSEQPLRQANDGAGPGGASWNAFFFYHPFKGRFDGNHARCPVTSKTLEALPGLCRRELVLFSALRPGSIVPPHCGPFNGRLRVHLALTGSRGCYLRVGTQIREWEDGKVLAFDDSFEHQVCHAGQEVRVVLMLNILQPGVSPSVVDQLSHTNPVRYVEGEADREGREALARTGWWG